MEAIDTPNRQSITAVVLDGSVEDAKKAMHASKDSAMHAAAYAYVIWVHTFTKSAKHPLTEWRDAQIKAFNKAVVTHNMEQKDLRNRVQSYIDKSLPPDDLVNRVASNEDEQKLIDDEKALLAVLSQRSDKDWSNDRMVSINIKANTKATTFSAIVKIVFGFNRASQASLVSRYATVLSWIEKRFGEQPFMTVAEHVKKIVAAMTKDGGFEVALSNERNPHVAVDDHDGYDGEDTDVVAKAINEKVKAAIAGAPETASATSAAIHSQGDVVMMIGRYDQGQIKFVGEVALNDDELDATVERLKNPVLSPVSPSTEFLHTLFDFGELIETGRNTDKTVDDAPHSDFHKASKAATLRQVGSERTQVVVSGVYVDASIVVYGTPNDPTISLGAPQHYLRMDDKSRKALERMLRDRAARRLADIAPDYAPKLANDKPALSRIAWNLTNSALAAAQRPNAVRPYFWNDMANRSVTPLDLDNFKPQFEVAITIQDLRDAYTRFFIKWQDKAPGKDFKKLVSLNFNNQSLTLKCPGEEDVSVGIIGRVTAISEMQFRPRDLQRLVEKLIRQPVDEFKLAGDKTGLLGVSWSDAYADYEVYVPICGNDGRLISRRVAQMVDPATVNTQDGSAQDAA